MKIESIIKEIDKLKGIEINGITMVAKWDVEAAIELAVENLSATTREQIESIMQETTIPVSVRDIIIPADELPVKRLSTEILDKMRYGT